MSGTILTRRDLSLVYRDYKGVRLLLPRGFDNLTRSSVRAFHHSIRRGGRLSVDISYG